jgi:hypothetical protein
MPLEGMDKIATPRDLAVLASMLRKAAEAVEPSKQGAGNREHLADDADDLVQEMDILIRGLRTLTGECKGMKELANHFKYSMKWLVDADSSLRSIRDALKKG